MVSNLRYGSRQAYLDSKNKLVSVFSLNSLKILKDLVNHKIHFQKQFKDFKEIQNLMRLEIKLTKLIEGFNK